MEKILEKYNQHKSTYSDINEHLETLYNLGKECSHITEMGVRWVSSTWPLVYSNPKKMISYDILKNPNISEVINLCNEYSINYSFEEKDVLQLDIEPTEIHQRTPILMGQKEELVKYIRSTRNILLNKNKNTNINKNYDLDIMSEHLEM